MKKKLFNYVLTPSILVVALFLILFSPSFLPNNSILNVDKKVELPFVKENEAKNILIFFGYVGCVGVCIPKLDELSRVYEKVKDKNNIILYFINLTENVTQDDVNVFVKSFNKEFNAVQLPMKELQKLKSDFNVYSAKSLNSDDELDHTSFVFLVQNENKEHRLKKIFTSSRFDEDFIVEELLGL